MIQMNGSPLGIAWFFLYGYSGVPAAVYMPQLRDLGAGFTKVYLFWQQIEPEKGRFDWTAVDAFVDQLNSPEEGLISIFSSSQWAVEHPSAMLPPSPAKDLDDYYRFIHAVVSRCKGKVRYWQNDAEPNSRTFWSGTKEQFVAQLRVFHKAVKDADPDAAVIVGGYDGMFNPPDMVPLPGQRTAPFPEQAVSLAFFDYVLQEGAIAFDIFELRLYGDPYTIVPRVEYMRRRMQAFGYEKPIVCAEYGGPNLFEFPENHQYRELITSWAQAIGRTGPDGKPSQDAHSIGRIKELYENMAALPPQTQMFMQGCSPELDATYQRIQSRSIVMRNLFALSAGVQKTLYWDLPNIHGDNYDLMTLMYGKIGLLTLESGEPTRTVSADAFARMAHHLKGVRAVKRIEIPGHDSVFLFEVARADRDALYVVWARREAFSGEALLPEPCEWAWHGQSGSAVDTFGSSVPVHIENRRIRVPVSITPLYVEARPTEGVL